MQPGEAAADRRTTPPWLQPIAFAALVMLSIYHLAAYQSALSSDSPWWLYFGRWQMFTVIDTTTEVVEGEAFYDGAWHPFDPQELFPFEWESGPRYARSGFYGSEGRMRVMAKASCTRFPRPIEQVRYTLATWRRRLGTMDRPKKVKTKELISWRCGVRP